MSTDDPLSALRDHITKLEAKPEHSANEVEVQHLLVSFNGAGTGASRSKEDAEKLAAGLLHRINGGEPFAELIREYTDDSPPGIYRMTTGKASSGVYQRGGMVAAFGDVGWRLEVGEYGVAGFDATKSPYGWHIIKRTN